MEDRRINNILIPFYQANKQYVYKYDILHKYYTKDPGGSMSFLLSKLLNPRNIIECNYLYKLIRNALEIRNTS